MEVAVNQSLVAGEKLFLECESARAEAENEFPGEGITKAVTGTNPVGTLIVESKSTHEHRIKATA